MLVDISRVNLLERDIEDWLFENPQELPAPYSDNPIVRWIGRQYQLPSGIADLIGLRADKKLVVVEVKNVPINKAAVLQVCRYTEDLKFIVSNRMDYPHERDGHEPLIEMILVGPSIDDQTFVEARAVGVRVLTFSAQLVLSVGELGFTRSQLDKVRKQYDDISERSEWEIYGQTYMEDVEQFLELVDSRKEDYSDIILASDEDSENDEMPL